MPVELFPHCMEREKSFTLTSMFGLIYDEVGKWQLNEDMGENSLNAILVLIEILHSII